MMKTQGLSRTATLTPNGNVTDPSGTCYQFVVAAKDSSVSPYDGRSQRIVRLFRIAVGEGYGIEANGFDTYVSEDDTDAKYCSETTLLVSGAQNGREVPLLRFDRQQLSTEKQVISGEVILHAASDLTDATLYYLEHEVTNPSKLCPAELPECASLDWEGWAAWNEPEENNHLIPVATAWDIKNGDLVRFDLTDYLKLKRYKCGWDSHPYFEFAIMSNDSTADRGFYASEETGQDHHPPRLAFYFTGDETTPSEDTTNKCSDCSDNDCDGDVDCDDCSCIGKANCTECP